MNEKVIVDKLNATPFEPFVIVTNAGDRYEVRHPEMARMTARHLYVFQQTERHGLFRDPTIVGLRNISALEPLPGRAA